MKHLKIMGGLVILSSVLFVLEQNETQEWVRLDEKFLRGLITLCLVCISGWFLISRTMERGDFTTPLFIFIPICLQMVLIMVASPKLLGVEILTYGFLAVVLISNTVLLKKEL